MAVGIFALLAAVAWLFPETPAGRWIHLHLVEVPMAMASKIERRHIVFLLVGLLAIQTFAMVVPADLAVLAAWDYSIYVDLIAATWAAAAVARVQSGWSLLTSWLKSPPRTVRASRPKRARRSRPRRRATPPPSNDDGPWREAAAA